MKSTFIMSVVGHDSPGSIKAIAEITRSHGGEWVTSKVIRLEGQLSAMMKVVISPGAEEQLKSDLSSTFPALHFFYTEAGMEEAVSLKSLSVVIDCKDRPGLTKDINDILAGLGLIVENMECNRAHVSTIGEAVFTAKVTLSVPEETSGEAVVEEIEALSGDVRVTIL